MDLGTAAPQYLEMHDKGTGDFEMQSKPTTDREWPNSFHAK